jgi:threonyl-tRNA synthetase
LLLTESCHQLYGSRFLSYSHEYNARNTFENTFLLFNDQANNLDNESLMDIIQNIPKDKFVGALSPEEFKDLSTKLSETIKQKQFIKRVTVSSAIDSSVLTHQSDRLKLDQIKLNPNSNVNLYQINNSIGIFDDLLFANTKSLHSSMLLSSERIQASEGTLQTDAKFTRIYGTGFNTNDAKTKWETLKKQAQERDHRLIGKNQELFMVHPYSPGAPFFLPHGTRIIHKLQSFLRYKYKEYGFEEVMTPILFKKDLWKISGHWDNYKDDMFLLDSHDESSCDHSHEDSSSIGLKPMNCPAHCLIFSSQPRTYKDLPIRFADFGALHRNEATGALSGLTRVRQFHQDDGHIFCTRDQVQSEISKSLKMLDTVYQALTFEDYNLTLSTRPLTHYMGELSEWEEAESALTSALNGTGRKWTIKEGDGAFYGPKIDIMVNDALGRSHQTATIQLDFQLPQRFKLEYQNNEGSYSRPVMVHRAIFGSIERLLAILMEHNSGKWPFWLSPRQALICPLPLSHLSDYATSVHSKLKFPGFPNSTYHVDIDLSNKSLSKKVRNGITSRYNYLIIIGEKEVETNTISVKTRDGADLGSFTVESLLDLFQTNEKQFL